MTTSPVSKPGDPPTLQSPDSGRPIRVGVIVLTYNTSRFVDGCFGSLRRIDKEGLEVDVIAVDNASSDGTPDLIRRRFPEVRLVENARNLGFAAGCNVGIRLATERRPEFVCLLNPDTEMTAGFLKEAVAVAHRFEDAGAVQSLLLLAAERDRVNTAGGAVHFLGFGYCGRFRHLASEIPTEPAEVAFASGASTLYRTSALEAVGLFDPELFLYHEDLDLAWRLRLAGYRNLVAPRSVVYHEYEFSRSPTKRYYAERNRYLVMLKNVRVRNLLILAPLLLIADLGLLAAAATSGWLLQKVKAMGYLLRPSTWRHVRSERRHIAGLRRVSDHEIFQLFTPRLELEGAAPPLLLRVANPLMAIAWRVVAPLIR